MIEGKKSILVDYKEGERKEVEVKALRLGQGPKRNERTLEKEKGKSTIRKTWNRIK